MPVCECSRHLPYATATVLMTGGFSGQAAQGRLHLPPPNPSQGPQTTGAAQRETPGLTVPHYHPRGKLTVVSCYRRAKSRISKTS